MYCVSLLTVEFSMHKSAEKHAKNSYDYENGSYRKLLLSGVILQKNEMVTIIVSGYPFTTAKITNERNWFFVSWKTCFQSPAVLLIINEIKCGRMTAPAFPRFFRSVVNTEFNFRFRGLWYQNHFIHTFIY